MTAHTAQYYTHNGKKWGIREAPCWEMLAFGGKIWREIVLFLYTKI